MESRSGESSNGDAQNSPVGSSSGNRDAVRFECNICFDPAQEPVVTLCGHLFCWPCLYEWLHGHSRSSECPVCKAIVEEEAIVPLYSGGNSSTESQSRSISGMDIPDRPAGRRPATAPQPRQPNSNNIHHHNVHHNPWFNASISNQLAGMRLGNFTSPYAATHHLAGTTVGNFATLNSAANDVAAVLQRGYTNVLHSLHAQELQHGHPGWHAQGFHQGHGHHHAYGFQHARRRNHGQFDIWMVLLLVVFALAVFDIISQVFL
ncbi:hypothetical protein Cni_G00370 [Canna indica]|uniref:E3 ubiquitin-protein ligase RMA n=1 Tax=Canna indica TaxID=4628 RepID=A0AAQ3JMN5_9LILI|nr:hypothetical protein Cni_G00370 [Canna indica]